MNNSALTILIIGALGYYWWSSKKTSPTSNLPDFPNFDYGGGLPALPQPYSSGALPQLPQPWELQPIGNVGPDWGTGYAQSGLPSLGQNSAYYAPLEPGDLNEVEILARTIWGEARGEGQQGMYAVANVVLNRVKKNSWWGKTIKAVCLYPGQFSCWNKNDPNRQKLLTVTPIDSSFNVALTIAQQAVNGNLPDITGGATHYHTISVKPNWSIGKQTSAQIGKHLFYKGIA